MDVLAAVMRELHVIGAGYRSLALGSPWAISFHQAGFRGIHIVTRGQCEIVFDSKPAKILRSGDLVIMPHADPHILRSVGSADVAVTPAADLAAHGIGGRIQFGGEGEEAAIVCGAFAFRETDHPSLAGLPCVVHVPGVDGEVVRWLKGYVDALLVEALDAGPGSDVVLARLSAAIVTRALREVVGYTGHPGWLKGLSDPAVAKALAAVHNACGEAWTIETLARSVGLSRAAFAAVSATWLASRRCATCFTDGCAKPHNC